MTEQGVSFIFFKFKCHLWVYNAGIHFPGCPKIFASVEKEGGKICPHFFALIYFTLAKHRWCKTWKTWGYHFSLPFSIPMIKMRLIISWNTIPGHFLFGTENLEERLTNKHPWIGNCSIKSESDLDLCAQSPRRRNCGGC